MKYKLTITRRKFANVKGEYAYVDVADEFMFDDWETLIAFLGYIVDNSITNEFTFKIKKVEEEEEA